MLRGDLSQSAVEMLSECRGLFGGLGVVRDRIDVDDDDDDGLPGLSTLALSIKEEFPL